MKGTRPPLYLHLLAVMLLLVMPVLFISLQGGGQPAGRIVAARQFWLFACIYLFIFYLNLLALLPYVAQRRALVYIFMVLVILVALVWAQPFDRLVQSVSRNGMPGPGGPPPFPGGPPTPGAPPPLHGGAVVDIVGIFLGIIAIGMGVAWTLLRQWKDTAGRLARAETEKLNAELAFLKARVNPHFLFNTLNNIYSLVERQNPAAGESILRLSAIMRYVTDEVMAEKVPLALELDCIEDFIALHQLRLNGQTAVTFSRKGEESGYQIAPLILMPFVENAFKYGVSNHEASKIVIETGWGNGEIWFICSNRAVTPARNLARPGTGIQNVRQRLQYLYPGRHHLEITEKKVTLKCGSGCCKTEYAHYLCRHRR